MIPPGSPPPPFQSSQSVQTPKPASPSEPPMTVECALRALMDGNQEQRDKVLQVVTPIYKKMQSRLVMVKTEEALESQKPRGDRASLFSADFKEDFAPIMKDFKNKEAKSYLDCTPGEMTKGLGEVIESYRALPATSDVLQLSDPLSLSPNPPQLAGVGGAVSRETSSIPQDMASSKAQADAPLGQKIGSEKGEGIEAEKLPSTLEKPVGSTEAKRQVTFGDNKKSYFEKGGAPSPLENLKKRSQKWVEKSLGFNRLAPEKQTVIQQVVRAIVEFFRGLFDAILRRDSKKAEIKKAVEEFAGRLDGFSEKEFKELLSFVKEEVATQTQRYKEEDLGFYLGKLELVIIETQGKANLLAGAILSGVQKRLLGPPSAG